MAQRHNRPLISSFPAVAAGQGSSGTSLWVQHGSSLYNVSVVLHSAPRFGILKRVEPLPETLGGAIKADEALQFAVGSAASRCSRASSLSSESGPSSSLLVVALAPVGRRTGNLGREAEGSGSAAAVAVLVLVELGAAWLWP